MRSGADGTSVERAIHAPIVRKHPALASPLGPGGWLPGCLQSRTAILTLLRDTSSEMPSIYMCIFVSEALATDVN